jgi:hypothetical protein
MIRSNMAFRTLQSRVSLSLAMRESSSTGIFPASIKEANDSKASVKRTLNLFPQQHDSANFSAFAKKPE